MRTVRRFGTAALAAGVLVGLLAGGIAGARTAAEKLQNGARGFQEYCAMCHGTEGYGNGDVAGQIQKDAKVTVARLNDAGRLATLGRSGVHKVIVEGGAHTGRSNLMPAWGDKLSSTLVDDITDYVMSLPSQKPGVPIATLQKYLEAARSTPSSLGLLARTIPANGAMRSRNPGASSRVLVTPLAAAARGPPIPSSRARQPSSLSPSATASQATVSSSSAPGRRLPVPVALASARRSAGEC
jgi:mono/diheme cytochrome c family protein